MNSDKFINLIVNPNVVTKKETNALETVLEEFPYFQAARVLHLKGLKNQHSFKYNRELKKTAAFTTNRTVLFDFITTNTLDFETISKNEEKILHEIDVIDSKVIDHLYKSIQASENNKDIITELDQLTNLDAILNSNVSKENNNKKLVKEEQTLADKLDKNKEVLEINKPINFKKEDTFSFNEWLQLKTKEPIKREDKVTKEIEENKRPQKEVVKSEKNTENSTIKSVDNKDLIEKFIKNKPKIKPVKNQINPNVSVESIIENTSLMTETLARVYLEQKKYKKAIAAFKILSLKYPEKSSFFADRIKAIHFLEKYKS